MRDPIPILAVIAALLPGCGDGLPKVYPDPSSPAEEDGRPMTPSQDPGIITQDCYTDPCGGYSWAVNFVLPTPAQSSGWIVQEIVSDRLELDGRIQRHFWEGFYVEAGSRRCVYSPLAKDGSPLDPLDPDKAGSQADDSYSNVTHANTTDVDTIIGKAKFYEGTLPADFVRKNDNTVVAKDRRSTTTQPPFWDGTGTDHNLSVAWDCTAGNDIRTLLSTPPLTGKCADRGK